MSSIPSWANFTLPIVSTSGTLTPRGAADAGKNSLFPIIPGPVGLFDDLLRFDFMQGETKFKQRVLKDLEKLPRCWVLKTQERARRGVLDLLICLRGTFIAIELKMDRGIPDKLQQMNIAEINAAGGVAFVSTPSTWPGHFQTLSDWRGAG